MMGARRLAQVVFGAAGISASLGASPPIVRQATSSKSVPLDLSPLFNNKAFGTFPGEASFDASGQSYPAPAPGDSPYYTSPRTGIVYSFPGYTGAEESDNVISDVQTINVPVSNSSSSSSSSSYFSASFLVAGDVEFATVTGNVTFAYADGSTFVYELRSLAWFSWLTLNRGDVIFPNRFTATGVNYNTSHIFERTTALPPGKRLQSITLPPRALDDEDAGRLHVFAISLWQGGAYSGGGEKGLAATSVDVQTVRPTQKWFDDGSQVVEITVNNAGSTCVAADGLTVTLDGGDEFGTTRKGDLKRLCPGDQKVVQVGINSSETKVVNLSVVVDDGSSQQSVDFEDVEIGLTDYTSDLDSLAKHESPDWFNGAKYGIFIHWGPYAVTGWGNSTPYESYAEWFWWYSTHHPQADRSDFYDYRLRTYGPDWAYDDTFPDFTATNYEPREWVDLFADAGAQYFVITSKHHDGFAIFDAGNTTNRSALHHGPQRDLLGELFDAARTYQPALKRGTYFSLPEWYNPDFGPYGFDQLNSTEEPGTSSWPGVLAKNPYTGVEEPYTGHIPAPNNFLSDVMLPQMEILAYDYEIDILWCDIGAANVTAPFASRWWNELRRQTAINSRCGLAEANDFDTPEYQTFASAQARKWESNRGMDPYSYGYNSATPDEAYMNASTLVYTLVDIVSKNGNLLLDIGPRADGSIVQAEIDTLREAGVWIRKNGEAIFNTTYWFVRSEIVDEGLDVRFTQTNEAFYALFLKKPVVVDGVVRIPARVPIVQGDQVSLLAVEGGEDLAWTVSDEGDDTVLAIEIDETSLDSEELGWVFKIEYA